MENLNKKTLLFLVVPLMLLLGIQCYLFYFFAVVQQYRGIDIRYGLYASSAWIWVSFYVPQYMIVLIGEYPLFAVQLILSAYLLGVAIFKFAKFINKLRKLVNEK